MLLWVLIGKKWPEHGGCLRYNSGSVSVNTDSHKIALGVLFREKKVQSKFKLE